MRPFRGPGGARRPRALAIVEAIANGVSDRWHSVPRFRPGAVRSVDWGHEKRQVASGGRRTSPGKRHEGPPPVPVGVATTAAAGVTARRCSSRSPASWIRAFASCRNSWRWSRTMSMGSSASARPWLVWAKLRLPSTDCRRRSPATRRASNRISKRRTCIFARAIPPCREGVEKRARRDFHRSATCNQSCRRSGRHAEEAVAILRATLRSHPADPLVHFRLGDALRETG